MVEALVGSYGVAAALLPRSVSDSDSLLGSGLDIHVDRATAADDKKTQIRGLVQNTLRQRSMMRNADRNSLKRFNHLLFRA